jgi:hypothetical protein
MMSYSILRTNMLGEKSIIYQTNTYAGAEDFLKEMNNNKCKYGYVNDKYEIIKLNYNKQIEKIVKRVVQEHYC